MEFRAQEVVRLWLASFFSQFPPNRTLHNSTCNIYPAVWKAILILKRQRVCHASKWSTVIASRVTVCQPLFSPHDGSVDYWKRHCWHVKYLPWPPSASPPSAPSGFYDLMWLIVCSLSKLIHTYPITAPCFVVAEYFILLCHVLMPAPLSFITQLREYRFHRNRVPY